LKYSFAWAKNGHIFRAAKHVKNAQNQRLVDDVDQKRMTACRIEKCLAQSLRPHAAPEMNVRPAQRCSEQENPQPRDQRKVVERRIARAVDKLQFTQADYDISRMAYNYCPSHLSEIQNQCYLLVES